MKLDVSGLYPSSLRLPVSIQFCCVIYIAYHKTRQMTHERYVTKCYLRSGALLCLLLALSMMNF